MAEEQSKNATANNRQEPRPEWVEWFRDYSVPIVGILCILLGLVWQPAGGHQQDWTRGKDLLMYFEHCPSYWTRTSWFGGSSLSFP